MNITNILLGIIILILLKQFYPAYADRLISVVINRLHAVCRLLVGDTISETMEAA